MLESKVEDHLVKTVRHLGGEVRKVTWLGHRGAPDRVVMFPEGVIWWVELKAPGKKAQKHQAREHEKLRAKGQIVLVLDSIEAVNAVLGRKHEGA